MSKISNKVGNCALSMYNSIKREVCTKINFKVSMENHAIIQHLLREEVFIKVAHSKSYLK